MFIFCPPLPPKEAAPCPPPCPARSNTPSSAAEPSSCSSSSAWPWRSPSSTPNSHKERIARLVREATGRELTLTGDIKLSVFPWIGVGLGPMRLSSPAGFGPMPFVEVKRAEVVVKLLPLISGQVVVKRVELEGLSLNLVTAQDGKHHLERTCGRERGQARG